MWILLYIKVGTHDGTSPCNKSQELVASCELAIITTKSSRRDQNLVPASSPKNTNWFEFVGLVTGTRFRPVICENTVHISSANNGRYPHNYIDPLYLSIAFRDKHITH